MLGNEQTLIKIGKQIKCPECAGQTIDTSTTPLSIELKKFIMNQLEQGAKPEHIVSEIKKTYGEDIFIDSGISSASLLIWIMPIILFVLLILFARKKKWL